MLEELADQLEGAEGEELELAAIDFENGINVMGMTTLSGGLFVHEISSIEDTIGLMDDVTFFGRPYFNKDSGGFALVKSGATSVEVVFEEEYLVKPIIEASITIDDDSEEDVDEEAEEELEVEEVVEEEPVVEYASEEIEEAVFEEGIRFIVTKRSETGFTIKLNKASSVDVPFNWIALAVEDAQIFVGEEENEEEVSEEAPAEEETPAEEPTPESEPAPEPEPTPEEETPEEAPAEEETPAEEPTPESEPASEPEPTPEEETPEEAPAEEETPSEEPTPESEPASEPEPTPEEETPEEAPAEEEPEPTPEPEPQA